MLQNSFKEKSDNGSGNGLVPSDNKPLLEPMLTQIYDVTRPQWVKAQYQN